MDIPAKPIVAFYLVHHNARESGCFLPRSDALTRASIDGITTSKEPESSSWRVTFDRNTTLGKPLCLVSFGSDPRCTVILNGVGISPLHCKIYAQLNSGPNMLVLEDVSDSGTSITDDDSVRQVTQLHVKQDRLSTEGLRTLTIGPYKFRIEYPWLDAEKAEARHWFFEHEPKPVTEFMLRGQLGQSTTKFRETCQVGQGGAGKIYRFVENNTGLLFAVKKQPECSNKLAEREVKWMKRMKNLQSEAVSTLHENGALHQDIKPDNFFVVRKRPLEIVLGDFGHTVSLQNPATLRHTTALDVYSLGVTFFVMIEFETLKPLDWKKRLERVAEHPPSFYGDLIKRMTARKPEERPNLQQCMEVVRKKECFGNSWAHFPGAAPVHLEGIGGKRSPARNPITHNIFAHLAENTRTHTRVPVVNGPPANNILPNRDLDRPAKAATHHNTFAHLGTGPRTNLPVTVIKGREPKRNATTHRNIFAPLAKNTRAHPRASVVNAPPVNTNLPNRYLDRLAKAATRHNTLAHPRTEPSFNPSVAYIEAQKRKDKATNRQPPFAHLNTNTTIPAPIPVPDWFEQGENALLRPQAQQTQPTNRTTRPSPQHRRTGTRDHLRRSPIRHANITRAFAIGKRVTRICDTTTNMAKCLYYLGAGVVTNTRDIALLGVDTFKLFKDVGRARQVIKHMQPEASIQLGDGMRLAAGMKSRELRFVTPAEYEEERMRSTQQEIGHC